MPFPFDRWFGNSLYLGAESGRRPDIRKPMEFFRLDGAVAQAGYGLIERSGKESPVTQLDNGCRLVNHHGLSQHLKLRGIVGLVHDDKVMPQPSGGSRYW